MSLSRGDFLDVAAVSGWPDHIEIFLLARNGEVWHRWWWNESKWDENLHTLGRPFRDQPPKGITALSGGDGHMDVLVEAMDGAVANIWFDDGWQRCNDSGALGDGWWSFS